MIKAVIFDMDGLLIDSEPLWHQAETDVFKAAGITVPTAEERHILLGRGVRRLVEYWYGVRPWEGLSVEEVADKIINDFTELFKQKGTLKAGAQKALDICKSANLPMAIASSSPLELIKTIVDKLDIHDYFSEIYSGENEPYGKPHPGVFITTANLFDVSPEECLVFEDAPSGVLAAKAARIKCIAVPEREIKFHPFIQTADVVLQSLEQFNEETLTRL